MRTAPLRFLELPPLPDVAEIAARVAQPAATLAPRLAAIRAPALLDPARLARRDVSPTSRAELEPVELAAAAGAQRRRSTFGALPPSPVPQIGAAWRTVRKLRAVARSAAWTLPHRPSLLPVTSPAGTCSVIPREQRAPLRGAISAHDKCSVRALSRAAAIFLYRPADGHQHQWMTATVRLTAPRGDSAGPVGHRVSRFEYLGRERPCPFHSRPMSSAVPYAYRAANTAAGASWCAGTTSRQ